MRAVVIRSHGGPDVLELTDIAQPHPGPGEVLVRVRAVSVNSFLDVSNRAGHVPFARYDFPHVLGSEHAGEVAGIGPGADTSFALGDAVLVSNTVPCGRVMRARRGGMSSAANSASSASIDRARTPSTPRRLHTCCGQSRRAFPSKTRRRWE